VGFFVFGIRARIGLGAGNIQYIQSPALHSRRKRDDLAVVSEIPKTVPQEEQ